MYKFNKVVNEIALPVDTFVDSKNLVFRNYGFGYRVNYVTTKHYKDILMFYSEELSSQGYNVKLYDKKTKIRAVKNGKAIVIEQIYEKDNKCKYKLYIKPNDIFEWGYLDLYFLDK